MVSAKNFNKNIVKKYIKYHKLFSKILLQLSLEDYCFSVFCLQGKKLTLKCF